MFGTESNSSPDVNTDAHMKVASIGKESTADVTHSKPMCNLSGIHNRTSLLN